MNQGLFFLLFIGGIIGMFIVGANGDFQNGLRSTTATDTSTHQIDRASDGYTEKIVVPGPAEEPTTSLSQGSAGGTGGSWWSRNSTSDTASEPRTNEEIQEDIEDLYDETWELAQKVESYKRKQPVSPYAELVTLRRSSVSTKDPDREYLTLSVTKNAPAIDISNWYIESYVTENRVNIPDGTYTYKYGGSINQTKPIILEPSQQAFLITGSSPINVSFQENSCIGYLREHDKFYPSLTNQCPRPMDLMERYGNIELDDDSCYDFVRRVGRCEIIEDDDERLEDLSNRCVKFAQDYLNYNSCVENFSWRTDFDEPNDWYIYFSRDEEQWRKKREIIRLIDENDRVVTVLEY